MSDDTVKRSAPRFLVPSIIASPLEKLRPSDVALDLHEDERLHLVNSIGDESSGCLTSLENFEDHYNARHTASSSVCSRVYPTSRLLSMHVSEAHDSFFQKVACGFAMACFPHNSNMCKCLLGGWGLKLKTYKAQQHHLIDKHKFPSSFAFYRKAHKQKHQAKQATHRTEVAPNAREVENELMDELVSAASKLRSTSDSPTSRSFDRCHKQSLTFVPRTVQHEKSSESHRSERKKQL